MESVAEPALPSQHRITVTRIVTGPAADTCSAEVFDSLAKERFLRGLKRDGFVDRLTHYFAEVNAIHPFREGNGWTQRAFFRQLAREAGWPIDWSTLTEASNIEASMASLRGDNRQLRGLVDLVVLRK